MLGLPTPVTLGSLSFLGCGDLLGPLQRQLREADLTLERSRLLIKGLLLRPDTRLSSTR